MKKINLQIVVFVAGLSIFETKGFNPGYYGNDPYMSLKIMYGPERFIAEDYIRDFPYYVRYVENLSHVDTSNIDFSKLPYPYNTLSSIVPYDAIGYYVNSDSILKLFASNNIVNALEIGSDRGLSTRHIASLLPEGGKLYAVDVWDFTNTCEAYNDQRYIPFLSNVIQVGLTDKIFPIRKSSQDAAEYFKMFRLDFDLIYVDGNHETEAVLQDLELYYPLLSEHGVMCGDDWMLKTVRAAIIQFAQKYQLSIYGSGNFWFFRDEGVFQHKPFLGAPSAIWAF